MRSFDWVPGAAPRCWAIQIELFIWLDVDTGIDAMNRNDVAYSHAICRNVQWAWLVAEAAPIHER